MSILGSIATAAAVAFIPGASVAFAVWKYGKGAVLGFLGRIPPKVWLVILAAALLVGGTFLHRHLADKAHDAAFAEGKADSDAAWRQRLADERAAGQRWKAQAEAKQTTISNEIGARHDQDLHRIDDRAGAERLRGPGHAAAPACGGQGGAAGAAAAAGGPQAAAAAADAGLAGVPPAEPMAIVPWLDLVQRARDHDGLLSEVKAWREWYAREAELNRQLREQGAAPDPAKKN